MLALLATGSAASAETLLMPTRDYLKDASEVVWGVTTQANGTAFVLDYGDGSPQTAGNVGDRSYIAFNHTYAASGSTSVRLCVGAGAVIPGCPGELATVAINVFDGGTISAEALRGLNINRTIQDGLRYLWTTQRNRAANFPAGVESDWDNDPRYSSLVVLAFENHGYTLPNSDAMPTGLYEKYVVRRGLNFIIDSLVPLALNTTALPTADDPCAGGLPASDGGPPCTGLYDPSFAGYSTSLLILPLAGSGASNRHVAEIPGTGSNPDGYVLGRTYGEILQRMVNALAWGQNDSGDATGRGGWNYGFNDTTSDGSTIGWNMLALLDAAAAGATVPAFVKTEFSTYAFTNALNTDGTFDYNAAAGGGSSPFGNLYRNMARVGVGLQASFYVGNVGVGDPGVAAGRDAASARWSGINGVGNGDFGLNDYTATCGANKMNKGCAYAMFNIFKGLKLQGVTTLAGVARPAGPGAIPAGDWYADYVDWLVNNQGAPQTVGGGHWNGGNNRFGVGTTFMSWACCGGTVNANVAMAELILSPVALVLPDGNLFATVGLSQLAASNAVGTNHTVTAFAQSVNGTPVPGATVVFDVLTGPNSAAGGSATTDANGEAVFTYLGAGGSGVDTIRAFIGQLGSNTLTKSWFRKCDANSDNVINATDLTLIRAANGLVATGPLDPRDGNSDGRINVADVRYCQLRLTPVP